MSIKVKIALIVCFGIIASILLSNSQEDQFYNSVNLQNIEQETLARQDFNEILAKFSRDYKTLDQFTTGLKNYKKNKAIVDKLNSENDGVKFKLNQFFDIDMEEFKQKYLGRKKLDEHTQIKIKADSDPLSSTRKLSSNEIQTNERQLWWFFDLFTKKTTTTTRPTIRISKTTTKTTTTTTKVSTTKTPVPTTTQTTTKAPTSTTNTTTTSSTTQKSSTSTSSPTQTTQAPNTTTTSTTTPSPSVTTQQTNTTTTKAPILSTEYAGDTGFFDWRTAAKVSPIRDQKTCGSCYAFSSMAALESLLLIKDYSTYKDIDLSEQQVIDCTLSYGNNGCEGGVEPYVYDYTKNIGIAVESKYPYTNKNNTCKSITGTIKTTGYKYIYTNLYASTIRSLVQQQPVSIGICASDYQFTYYSSGIFANTSRYKCCTAIDHALVIVGFGRQGTVPYWILKNSWGTSWGESGYMRIQMIENAKIQTCGIGYDLTYPII